MKSNHADLCKTAEELAGEASVAEHGHVGALKLYATEYDRLKELETSIIEASVALRSDTIVNHLHMLTGVEAILIERYGLETINARGLVEMLKELVESHDRLAKAELPATEEETPASKPDNPLVKGRIVRYVDLDGDVIPALVTKVMANDVVALHAFPVRSASYPVPAANYSLGPMVSTWHWPND